MKTHKDLEAEAAAIIRSPGKYSWFQVDALLKEIHSSTDRGAFINKGTKVTIKELRDLRYRKSQTSVTGGPAPYGYDAYNYKGRYIRRDVTLDKAGRVTVYGGQKYAYSGQTLDLRPTSLADFQRWLIKELDAVILPSRIHIPKALRLKKLYEMHKKDVPGASTGYTRLCARLRKDGI